MYKNPFVYIEAIKTLHPNLVIVHAEAEGDFASFANELHQHGMEVGVALLPETSVDILSAPIGFIDHVLIFSGHLSQFGGQADLSLLEKVRKLREQKPSVEIGWDGGVSEKNARELAKSGVDVLNVGGHIHQAPNPQLAFNELAVAANGPAT